MDERGAGDAANRVMLRTARIPSVIVIGLGLLAGCVAPSPDEPGTVASAHEAGAVIRDDASPFHWIDAPPSDAAPPRADAPAADPRLASRVQAWSDRLHGVVMKQSSRRAYSPPRPIVHVVASRALNANATGALVDMGATLGVEGHDQSGAALLTTTSIVPLGVDTIAVAKRPNAWPSNESFAALWSQSRPTCDLVYVGSNRLRSTRCAEEARGAAVVAATTPHVYVNSALLARVDEETFVSVLAHELGHYYRAHASSLTSSHYGFWYEATDGRHRPVPSERAEEIATRYASVLRAARGPVDVARVYHRRMVRLLAFFALYLGGEPAVERLCSGEVKAAATSTWLTSFLVSDDAREPDASNVDAFRAYERGVAACASKLRLGDRSSVDTILRAGVSELVSTEGLAPADASTGRTTTLAELLAVAESEASKLDERERAMLDRLREGRIGLYTYEEEADDVMLELAAQVGLPVERVFDPWLTLMRAFSGARSEKVVTPASGGDDAASAVISGDLDADRCRALLDAGFTAASPSGERRPVFVTLGDLDDPHHGSCYRLFNLWREARDHGYSPVGTFSPPPSGGSETWAELQRAAATLTEAAPAD